MENDPITITGQFVDFRPRPDGALRVSIDLFESREIDWHRALKLVKDKITARLTIEKVEETTQEGHDPLKTGPSASPPRRPGARRGNGSPK